MLSAEVIVALQGQPANGPVYDDAYIEHWGEVYLANPEIRARGVLFITFLAHPAEILRAVQHSALRITSRGRSVLGRDPKLDAAFLALADAAIAQLERKGAACSNGRMVEKLRHHRHPSARRSSFEPERTA